MGGLSNLCKLEVNNLPSDDANITSFDNRVVSLGLSPLNFEILEASGSGLRLVTSQVVETVASLLKRIGVWVSQYASSEVICGLLIFDLNNLVCTISILNAGNILLSSSTEGLLFTRCCLSLFSNVWLMFFIWQDCTLWRVILPPRVSCRIPLSACNKPFILNRLVG